MHEFHEYQGRRWVVVFASVIAALLIATAAVFAGRTIYRSARHETIKQPAVEQTQPKNQPAKVPSETTQPAATPSLPNNGPGNPMAIFIISSTLAGGLHYGLKRLRGA